MNDVTILGNFLSDNLIKEYNGRDINIGIKFYTDFNDRRRDECENKIDFGIESCYGDYFVILPSLITAVNIPFLVTLLRKPYMGKMTVSKNDNRMQVRISGYIINKIYEEELTK